MKKQIWLPLLILIFTGCDSNVNFVSTKSEGEKLPSWSRSLTSYVANNDNVHIRGKVKARPVKSARVKSKKVKTPKWVGTLKDEVNKEVHIRGKVRLRPQKTVNDVVKPQKPKKAPWVKALKRKLEKPLITGKFQLRAETQVGTDLVGSRPVRQSRKKVDIIFSLDTSDSMYEFLSQAEYTFAGFTHALQPLDWRIYFVNADYGQNGDFLFSYTSPYSKGKMIPLEDDGELLRKPQYLSKAVYHHESVFLDTLSHHAFDRYSDYGENYVWECDMSPGCGGWNEQPLSNLRAALLRNKGKFRPDAAKVVIVVSDNDEEGNLTGNVGHKTTPADIVNVFKKLYRGNRWVAYGVLMPVGDKQCSREIYAGMWNELVDGDTDTPYTSLTELAKLSGGRNYSLCEKSYKPLAKKIVADFL